MKKKIISVTTGTRADYGLLRPILEKILESKKLKLILIVTGSHLSKQHGYTLKEIEKDGYKIYAKIQNLPKNDTLEYSTASIGKTIIEFSKIFKKVKPDINLIYGDRDEMLASSIAASHMNIVNAHIHGGDISGGLDEYNRHAITKMSNIHFPATKKSKDRIIQMGENKKYVFQTGSSSIDEIFQQKIISKSDLEKKYHINFKDKQIVLLYHPVTTQIKNSEIEIEKILKAIKKIKKSTIIIAPNSDPGFVKILRIIEKFNKNDEQIQFYRNIPRQDYLGLLKNCSVLIGNSSSGMIEATCFKIPVINIGNRQKGRETGQNVITMKNPTITEIFSELKKVTSQNKRKKNHLSSIYGNGTASKKIVNILETVPLNRNFIEKDFNTI